MLRRLTVENYALIDRLELELDAHLNIITGETGAGKSILVGALGLLLGAKNDGTAMKNATKSCRVEGTFDLRDLNLEAFFEENDLDFDIETTLTRVINPSGKSRAFINDLPVTLQQMRQLGSRLVDIHSQHQNLIISDEEFRTAALDTVAQNEKLLASYRTKYEEFVALRHEVARLKEEAASARRDEEWLRYQCEELRAANLRLGEQAQIEEQVGILENADRIGEAFESLAQALDNDEGGILSQLRSSENDLRHITDKYPQAASYAERLHTVLEELKDINASVADDRGRIECDPQQLEKITTRLDTLISLQQKHRCTTEEELIGVRDQYSARLETIDHGDENIATAEKALAVRQQETQCLADQLHQARKKAAPKFAQEILRTLVQLGMPDTRFEVGVQPLSQLGATGGDCINFLFSANKNRTLQPIDRIASGGELSRVMLSLKAMLATRIALPTILFDEIDTGVSGRIADAMGEIMERLSERMQVIDITHLPQVASKGKAHFVVYKHEGHTSIDRLTEQERTLQIAKMLSGSEVTDAAIAQAKILLGKK